MTLQSQVHMAASQSLTTRIAAAAASMGLEEPVQWAQRNIWKIISAQGWDDAWDYAEAGKTINVNPDTGMRDDVINDQMILDAVQDVITEQTPSQ